MPRTRTQHRGTRTRTRLLPPQRDQVNEFLTSLAVDRKVAASTQNQALSGTCSCILYRHVLKSEVKFDAVRAKKPERLPVVLSIEEVRRLLEAIPDG